MKCLQITITLIEDFFNSQKRLYTLGQLSIAEISVHWQRLHVHWQNKKLRYRIPAFFSHQIIVLR